LTTNHFNPKLNAWTGRRALVRKGWQESRARFFCALALLAALVIYAVSTGPGFLARYNGRFPDKPLTYSAYVWSGLFHYALQGLWILAVFILSLGGLAREKAMGMARFSLALPVKRLHFFLIRTAIAWVEAIALGLSASLLIPVLSRFVGESYPYTQALQFGLLMCVAGLVLLSLGLLLSELFEGEFTATVVGLCGFTALFLGYKSHTLRGWNMFDVMSASKSIDPTTQLLRGDLPWAELAACLVISSALLLVAGLVIQARDF
jgi:ABC-type transport system involved in multi-copper enzyme maturation permease subunit